MRHLKSYIDVLFILLLGSIAMLTGSYRLGAVDAHLLRLGGQWVSPIRADEVRVVAVGTDALVLEGRAWQDPQALAAQIRPGETLLLVAADPDVRHHRVMTVWSMFRSLGRDVKLGAEPAAAPRGKQEGG